MRFIKGKELAALQARAREHSESRRAKALTAMVAQVKAEGGSPDAQRRKTIEGYLQAKSSPVAKTPASSAPGPTSPARKT